MHTRERPQSAQETPAQVRATAEAWFRHQAELLRQCHGSSWSQHREWVLDYLREEVRQRLIARGWRPRDGQ